MRRKRDEHETSAAGLRHTEGALARRRIERLQLLLQRIAKVGRCRRDRRLGRVTLEPRVERRIEHVVQLFATLVLDRRARSTQQTTIAFCPDA